MKEEWKDITGYEGYYKVSCNGNVLSLKNNIILKQSLSKTGYMYVPITHKGNRKKHKVHRLVAESFINNPDKLPQINHIDENKFNNSASNLEWCTSSYNVRYSQARKIKGISITTKEIITFDALIDCKAKGFDTRSILRSIKGEYAHHHGYKWSYA